MEYERRFGVKICEIYGSTEGGGTLINRPGDGPVGSIGKPLPGYEAACFDEAGRRCDPFELGELVSVGLQTAAGLAAMKIHI